MSRRPSWPSPSVPRSTSTSLAELARNLCCLAARVALPDLRRSRFRLGRLGRLGDRDIVVKRHRFQTWEPPSGRALDVDAGKSGVQPARQPLGPRAEQFEHGGQQRAADYERVEEHRNREAEPELLKCSLIPEGE